MKKIIILLMVLILLTACTKVIQKSNSSKDSETNFKNLAFTVQFDVKPEYVEEFKESLLYVLDSMAVEDTFVACYLNIDPKDPTKFTVYEVWSEPSMDAFFKNQLNVKEYRKEYEENLPEMLKSDRVITVLETVQQWHK